MQHHTSSTQQAHGSSSDSESDRSSHHDDTYQHQAAQLNTRRTSARLSGTDADDTGIVDRIQLQHEKKANASLQKKLNKVTATRQEAINEVNKLRLQQADLQAQLAAVRRSPAPSPAPSDTEQYYPDRNQHVLSHTDDGFTANYDGMNPPHQGGSSHYHESDASSNNTRSASSRTDTHRQGRG